MGCEPGILSGRPCDLPGCAASANPWLSFALDAAPLILTRARGVQMRFIGLDVHQGFCEVAIREDGKTRSAGRVATGRGVLELFAGSLCPTDEVVMEATGP